MIKIFIPLNKAFIFGYNNIYVYNVANVGFSWVVSQL